MVAERFTSPRARALALAVAFSVVAGGVAAVAVPQLAAATEEGDGSAIADGSAITTDSTSIPFSEGGFTPGNVVYAQLTSDSGFTNFSWNSTPYTANDDGVVSGELTSADGWPAGAYTVTLFESEDVQESFQVEIAEAGETPVETDTETTTPAETTPAETTPVESTPAETETPTIEPPATEPPATDPPVIDPPADPEPTETEPADTEPADTEPGDDGDTATEPTAWADESSYTQAMVAAEGVTYFLAGFTPGVELEMLLTLPSGEQAEFASQEPIVPGEDGTYTGVITYAGEWPSGDYSVSVRTKDGQMIPVDLAPPAGDQAAGDDGASDGATDEGATDDGATDDGATDDGAADDGAADDGAADDG
ncbi:MAG: hypothetical protein ACTH31_07500, partial [Pseudoclavibacter sp.]